MSDPLFDLTRGLQQIEFQELCDYVSESVPFEGTNLLIYTRHRSLFDERKAEQVRHFLNNDESFPEIWEEFKRSRLEEEAVALLNEIKKWGSGGHLITFARSVETGKFLLLPRSAWIFAEFDLESRTLDLDGQTIYRDPVFFLQEDVPDHHLLLSKIREINDPDSEEQQDDLAHGLQAKANNGTQYKTGLPGRPTSRHLIKHEFERCVECGLLETSLAKQASVLATWLAETHPAAPPSGEKAIKNFLRDAYRNAKNGTAGYDPK